VAWKSKIVRVLEYTAKAVCVLGVTGWVWAGAIYQSYLDLPRSPNLATGNIYPLNIHGTVVYQTLQEQLHRQRWEFWSWQVVVCGAALFAIYKLISGKQGKRTP
jgi:hypothetical protein